MSFSIMGAAGPLPLIPVARTLRLLNVYTDRLNSIICHPPVASGQLCSPPPSPFSLNSPLTFPCYLMHLLKLTHMDLFPLIDLFLITIWLETSIRPLTISHSLRNFAFPHFPLLLTALVYSWLRIICSTHIHVHWSPGIILKCAYVNHAYNAELRRMLHGQSDIPFFVGGMMERKK